MRPGELRPPRGSSSPSTKLRGSLLFHVVILSFLDVLQSFYSNFISFFGTNLLTQCQVPVAVFACFLHRRKSISNGVQTPQNFLWIFYGPEDHQWARAAPGGCPEGGTTHQGAPGPPSAPRWVVPTSVASRTPSLSYKFTNIPKTLGVNLDQKLCHRKAL